MYKLIFIIPGLILAIYAGLAVLNWFNTIQTHLNSVTAIGG